MRKMEFKTTLRFYLTYQNGCQQEKKCWWGLGVKARNLLLFTAGGNVN
jgi:hypothetical protein